MVLNVKCVVHKASSAYGATAAGGAEGLIVSTFFYFI